jgi:methylenetetrahydrofolate dehydrogenase (NADP+)/methenyltetrahydrofolate cyclohydrolase
MSTIIDGKQIAKEIRVDLADQVQTLLKDGIKPGLAVIIIGEDPASLSYVKAKAKACEEIGIHSEIIRQDDSISEERLLLLIQQLNEREDIHGILVQLPLPQHISEKSVIEAILPEKDVDGFHPQNVGNMLIGTPSFLPCTPYGIVKLLQWMNIPLQGKHAVVVGRSNIVGKPIAMLLLEENATVSICHSKTAELPKITRQADILVVAVGKPHFIGAEHITPGTVIIDVGVNRVDGKLVGDVHFDEVKDIVSYITPVPGGVGPMTITMLLHNTLQASRRIHKLTKE